MSYHYYLTCVMCGKNTYLGRLKLESFDRFEGNWKLLQVREAAPGPGRGVKGKGVGGFPIIKELGLDLREMIENPEHRALGLAVKGRILRIVREYIQNGIISKKEIENLIS